MSWSSKARNQRRLIRVGGVDADVQRRQSFGDHPLQIGLGEPSERREVAVQKAQPVIVVLQVQALAEALGQLVDEAELAVVVAGAHSVENGARHLGTKWLTCTFGDFQRQFEPIAEYFQREVGVVNSETPFNDVAWRFAVDCGYSIADGQPSALGGGPGRDSDNDRERHGLPGYRSPSMSRSRRAASV